MHSQPSKIKQTKFRLRPTLHIYRRRPGFYSTLKKRIGISSFLFPSLICLTLFIFSPILRINWLHLLSLFFFSSIVNLGYSWFKFVAWCNFCDESGENCFVIVCTILILSLAVSGAWLVVEYLFYFVSWLFMSNQAN